MNFCFTGCNGIKSWVGGITAAVCIAAGSSLKAQGVYSQKLYAYKEVALSTLTSSSEPIADTSAYINYLFYVELPQPDTPIWRSAVIGSNMYDVHADLVENLPVVVGERKRDQKLVTIKNQPGTRLWRLSFDLTEEKVASPEIAGEEKVVLKGMFKSRIITSTVRGMVELQPH